MQGRGAESLAKLCQNLDLGTTTQALVKVTSLAEKGGRNGSVLEVP